MLLVFLGCSLAETSGPAPSILAMFMNTAIDQNIEKFKADVSFSFVDSSMFIAIAIKENLFEPTFGASVLDVAPL